MNHHYTISMNGGNNYMENQKVEDQKGIFPAAVDFSTDLHSMGQFIQDGSRIMFETVLNVEKATKELTIEEVEGNVDGLNFLAGKTVDFVNKQAFNGTLLAHCDGGVPNMILNIPERSHHTTSDN